VIRATNRTRAMLVVAATLVAAAFITPAGAAPIPAATAVFLVLLIVVSRASLNTQVGVVGSLKVKRVISKPLISGKPAVVKVVLRNDSLIPLELVEVFIPYPRVFRKVKGSSTTLTTVPPKSSVEVSLELVPRVGEHAFEPVKLVLRDILGLFKFEANVTGKEVVRVLPALEGIRALGVTYTSRPGELSRTRRKGHGVEFYGIREYVPGDEYRRIEWKASARHGMRRLFVKEFEHEVSLNIFLVLDTSLYMLSGGWGRTPLEYSVRAAASIAAYALRRGDSVAVIHRFVDRPALVRGRRSLVRVIDDVSRLPWDAILKLPSAELRDLVLRKLMPVLPRERNVIIVFTILYGGIDEAREIVEVASKLKALGNTVMVIVPMVEAFEAKTLEGIEAAVYRLRSLGMLKSKMEGVKLLLRHGIPTVTALPSEITDIVVARLESIRSSMA